MTPGRARGRAALLVGVVLIAAAVAKAAEPRAEIQINLCSAATQVEAALRLDARPRTTTVWLFDSPTLELHRQGLRLRLRERGPRAELTVKVGGQDCVRVDPASLGPAGKCEADLHGDSVEDVVSVDAALTKQQRQALLPQRPVRAEAPVAALAAALSREQRSWLASRRGVAAGAPLLPSDLMRLGPSNVRSYRAPDADFGVEVWTLPGGKQFVELSEKVRRDTAPARRSALLEMLARSGVSVCADQASQARSKLEWLARQ